MENYHDFISVRSGNVFVEDCDVVELAKKHGTPLNILSETQLRTNYRNWKNALEKYWTSGSVNILPSVKSNLTLATRYILTEEGAGCDTFGESELYVALKCGVDPKLISINGTAKSRSLIRKAIEIGARITIDNPNELEVINEEAMSLEKVARVRFRLRLYFPKVNEPTDFMEEEIPIEDLLRVYKPGIPFKQALELGKKAIAFENIDLVGVHMHVARNSHSLSYWDKTITNLIEMVSSFHKEWNGWIPLEIDVGGGFAQPYDPSARMIQRVASTVSLEEIPSIEDYCKTIAGTVQRELDKHGISSEDITLEVEPGRAMYGNIGIHVAEVLGTKVEKDPTELRWVEVNSTSLFLSSIVYEHASHQHLVCNKADQEVTQTADIVGISCTFDRMKSQAELPDVTKGDLIAFLNTGAYEDAWAPNFNGLPRAPSILVLGGKDELVKERETIEQVFNRDRIPNRFK